MAGYIKRSDLRSTSKIRMQKSSNLILFNQKKEEIEIYAQVDLLIERYAKQNNLSIVTFENKKGNIKILYQSKSFVKELAKKAKEEDFDISFILKIRQIAPKNKKTNELLLKFEQLIIN